jgi:DNA processing protein
VSACAACLERSRLLGDLAPTIDRALRARPAAGRDVVALCEDDLVAAFGPPPAVGASAYGSSARKPAAGAPLRTVASLCRHDRRYPPRLLDLDADAGPPAVVYVGGTAAGALAELVDGPAVTLVGARRASSYALETAYELGRALAVAGVTVVSGLALGIDAAAHRGALDAGGRAIAVVASGADVVYPRSNRALHEAVAASGAVVSELPPGTPAFRWAFPARNRIMAALGSITVVVECARRSGSLITAACADRMGRTVGVVPGRIDSPLAAGSNALLADGAHLVVTGIDSILDELFGVGRGARAVGSDLSAGSDLAARSDRAGLDAELRAVYELAAAGAGIDRIAAESGLTAAAARAALGQLELTGLLVRDELGGYRPGRR